MKGLRVWEKGFGGPPWLWMTSTENVRPLRSDGDVAATGRNGGGADMGAEGGGGGYDDNGWSEPSASCMEGRDWRAGGLCSFSSPDMRRDSGGEGRPLMGGGSVVADED